MAATIAEERKDRFIKLLHELFQLDKPELDFGLYRIMHAKSDQLSRFIREDLAQAIEEAFAEQGEQQLVAMRQEIEEKHRQAEEFGAPDPDNAPAVKQARAAYDIAKREQNASADIYDHLYRFFSRYYDKGDFMSRRHHVAENDSRAAPYAVPYDGREVYLHWANKDQYYVKSSETLANFTFNLNEALKKLQGSAAQAGLGFDSVDAALKVHCRVVDATEGEHNDVKESTERFFIIHRDEPAHLEGADLVLQFEYRPDPEKTGQSGTWQKKRLEEAEEIIMATLRITDGVAAYRDGLATRAPTDKQKDRTLLAKYLQQYTARNIMDYFIHKDLGGFLSRELDFYIKNEILRLDDIDSANVLIAEQQLKKIQVLRRIAKQIITFLAQLENFQKKLWLKKKFVTESGYCISLTLLKHKEELLKKIFYHTRQRQQWFELFSLDLDRLDIELKNSTIADLIQKEKYGYLMADTGILGKTIEYEVLSSIDNPDKVISGVLVNSDNFQGLRLVSKKLEADVKCSYIDPPYNTGSDEFRYKDRYQHSSWMSMLVDRLVESKLLMSESAGGACNVNDIEDWRLRGILENHMGNDSYVATVITKCSTASSFRTVNVGPVDVTDRVLFFAKNKSRYSFKSQSVEKPVDLQHFSRFVENIEDHPDKWIFKSIKLEVLHSLGFFCETTREGMQSAKEKWGDAAEAIVTTASQKFAVDNAERVFETKTLQKPSKWLKGHIDESKKNPEKIIVVARNDAQDILLVGGRQFYFLSNNVKYIDGKKCVTEPASTLWLDINTNNLKHEGGVDFANGKKPIKLIKRIIDMSSGADGDYILDYYAGSGSTGHAVIEGLRDGTQKNKYLLVEMGGQFDEALLPRIMRSSYSRNWRNGAPKAGKNGNYQGVTQFFKYIRLESYDDTLNNLELDEHPKRDALMAENSELRCEYNLKYLLDIETRGSASLLNTERFRNPEDYKLKVKQPGSDETRETAVDLVETFNWLIGLQVTYLDKPRTYVARFEREEDPELPEDQNTRLKAVSLRENEDGAYWIRQVEGHVRRIPGSDEDLAKALVVWRKLTDDPEKDAAVLEALLEKYKIGTTDSEFDAIYINGPHGLNLTGKARSRVHSLEETFHARMWEGCDDDL